MAGHTSEKRWRNNQTNDSGSGVSVLLQSASENVIASLSQAEILYLELLELYTYCGSTAQGLADQLFYEDWSVRESDPIGNPGVLDTQANTVEVEKAQAAVDAATAMHRLYQLANNEVVAQGDYFSDLRRMS